MPPPNHHRHNQKLQETQPELTQAAQHGLRQGQTLLQFETVDEMLRHDARQTRVPPALAQRIREAVAREQPPRAPWWRRVLG